MNDKNFFGGSDAADIAAVKNPQIADLLSKLSADDRKKLRQVLNDPEQTKRILATPQAQALIRSLQSQNGENKQ